MNIEKALLSKIVSEKDFTHVAEAGITEHYFYEPSNREVFERIHYAVTEHGAVPSEEMLKRDFPTYKFLTPEKTEDPFSLLIEELRRNRSFTILEQAVGDAAGFYEKDDLEGMLKVLSGALNEVAGSESNTRDVNIAESAEEILDYFEELQNRDPDSYLGIPMGFKTIDDATQGWQPGQLVVMVGPPKAGKSTIMAIAANKAFQQSKSPLVVGFEMSNEEQYTRLFAMEAGVDHTRITGGKDRLLSDRDWENLEEAADYYATKGVDFWLSNDTHNATTLTGVGAKVDKYKPDLLVVDGVYMMIDEITGESNTPQALTNITRGFKRMAQNKQIPIVITTQVLEWKMDKKKGIQSSSIGYSSSFAQDADVIIGVEKTEDPNTNKVKIVLARNSPPRDVYVRWDWSQGKFEELDHNPFEEGEDGGEDGFQAGY